MDGGRDLRKVPWWLRYRVGARLASDVRRLLILATHRHCHVSFGDFVRLGPGFSLFIPGTGTFEVGSGVEFRRRFHCEVAGDGRVTIGSGTHFNGDVLIQCSTVVEIADHAMIGPGTIVVDGFHRFRDPGLLVQEQGYEYRPVSIGRGAVVAGRCIVNADVGERAMVAGGSVVVDPVPPYSFAAGSPARVIDTFGP